MRVFDNERFVLDKDDTIITYFYFSANDMLLFLRDADVVDEWLRTQQAANTTSTVDEQVDLETCEKEIHDLEKRQGKRYLILISPYTGLYKREYTYTRL